jgi:hypothetical protein
LVFAAIALPVLGAWLLIDSMVDVGWSSLPVGVVGIAVGAATILLWFRWLQRRSSGTTISKPQGRTWAVAGAAVLIVVMRAVDGVAAVFLSGVMFGFVCVGIGFGFRVFLKHRASDSVSPPP